MNYDVAYREYLIEVSDARDNVSFLLDNLGVDCDLAFDVESLEKAEAAYWNFLAEGESPELTDEDHFAQLLGQFLAQTVEETLGVSLSQCPDSGQPVICGFGEFEGREIYPVRIAAMLKSLPDEFPNFPGLSRKRVFADAFEVIDSVVNSPFRRKK